VEWVLIIWLNYGGFSIGYAAIDHIPGFVTEDQCTNAGDAWQTKHKYKNANFLCIEQGGNGLGKITVGSP